MNNTTQTSKRNPETIEARVCSACVNAIASDCFDGLTDKEEAIIRQGIHRWSLKGYWLAIGNDLGFTWQSCDCCGSTLGGDKHELFIMPCLYRDRISAE